MLRTDEMGQLPAFDRTQVVDAFLEAARFAGEALGADEVERLWLAPSALAQMSVGDLTGHILLVMRRVSQHIDSDRHLVPRSTAADSEAFPWAWLRVAGPEDLDRPEHRQVRSDSAFVAGWGCQAVRASFRRYYERAASVLPEACPAVAKVGDRTLPFPPTLQPESSSSSFIAMTSATAFRSRWRHRPARSRSPSKRSFPPLARCMVTSP